MDVISLKMKCLRMGEIELRIVVVLLLDAFVIEVVEVVHAFVEGEILVAVHQV